MSRKKYFASYRQRNQKKIATAQTKWRKSHVEYVTVRSHHYLIFKSKKKRYKGMLFFDEWNPNKGGSFETGAKWIITNLGKRPKGTSLHIIKQERGFMPGNLEWTFPTQQSNQQMFKAIAKLKNKVRRLEEALSRC